MPTLTTRIKEYREAARMTQGELAARVQVRRETIVHLENGRYNPSLKLAMDIAKVFGTGGVADGNCLCAGANGGADGIVEEIGVCAGGIVGDELHIGAEGAAAFDGFPDGGQHGLGLFVEQILHLNGADGGGHLKPGLLCLLQCVPGGLDAVFIQRHGHRHSAAAHGGGHGFDPQGIDFGLDDGLQLNEIHPQLVEQLA